MPAFEPTYYCRTRKTYASCLKSPPSMPTLPSYYENQVSVYRQTHDYPGIVTPKHNLVLLNRQRAPPPVADCQLIFVENTYDQSTTVRVTQSTQTSDDTESLTVEPSTPSTLSCAHMPFPPNDYPTLFPAKLNPESRLNFALYPVTRFQDWYWEEIWTRPTLVLDLYVKPREVNLSHTHHLPTSTYFQPETEFIGIKYRVTIEADRCHRSQALEVRKGDTVDVCGTNRSHGRYIVEACQLIRNGHAYLAVHFHTFQEQGFTDTRDPCHPSFILEVPQSFCKSPLMSHLQPPIPRRVNTCKLFNLLRRKTSSLTVLRRRLTIPTSLDLKKKDLVKEA
jgi:hypothetical protein